MNAFLFLTLLVITFLMTFRFYQSQKVSLDNRVFAFVFSKKAAIELSQFNNFLNLVRRIEMKQNYLNWQ